MFSEGQATVERGFSINNIVAAVNSSSHNLIARSFVKDHVCAIDGLKNLAIINELVLSGRAARKRYHASSLEKQKERKYTKKMVGENYMEKKFAISRQKSIGLI